MNIGASKAFDLLQNPNIVKLGVTSWSLSASLSHSFPNLGLVDISKGSGAQSTNYQVPAGKKFVPIAFYMRLFSTAVSAGFSLSINSATAAVTVGGAASVTGQAPILGYEGNSGVTIMSIDGAGPANTVYEEFVPIRPNIGVAQNLFPFLQYGSATDIAVIEEIMLFGTLA